MPALCAAFIYDEQLRCRCLESTRRCCVSSSFLEGPLFIYVPPVESPGLLAD